MHVEPLPEDTPRVDLSTPMIQAPGCVPVTAEVPGQWTLFDPYVNDKSEYMTVEINADGTITGMSDCQSFTGTAEFGHARLLMSTSK